MFEVDKGKIVYKKFISSLEENIKVLKSDIKTQIANKKLFETLINYGQEGDISLLYPYKDCPVLSPEVRDAIKKLEFLERHNATAAPQYLKAKEKIQESEESKSAFLRVNQINSSIQKSNTHIKVSREVMSGEITANNLSTTLDLSGLSSEERLMVLKMLVYEDCQRESIRKEQLLDDEKQERSVRISEVKEKINRTIEELSKFVSDNYKYIEGQSKEQLRLKSMVSFFNTSNYDAISINEIKDTKEYLQVLLITAIAQKSNLENVLHEQLKQDTTEDELALIEEMNIDAKSSVSFGEKLLTVVEENDKEKNEADPSKIVILEDAKTGPVIDFEQMNPVDIKNVEAIFKKLENGQYDYIKGIKHSRLLTDDNRIKETIYVNRKDKVACSYVRLTEDMVLVLAYGNIRDIYDKSKGTYVNNKDTIEDMVNLARNDIDSFKSKYIEVAKGGKKSCI